MTQGGGGVTEPPPTTEEPLRAEIIPNATQGVTSSRFTFDPVVYGGAEPFTCLWRVNNEAVSEGTCPSSLGWQFVQAGTYNVCLAVIDSKNQYASACVQITIRQLPPGGVAEIPENPTVSPEALLEEEEEQPPAAAVDEGTAPPVTEEEEEAATTPPVDNTG